MPALSSRLTVLKTRPRSVVLLPDHRFFVRSVPLSTDAEAGTARQQIELALEAIAPFPLAQLYWGYWTRPGCARALVFAAYKKRFSSDETEGWADAEWVAPRFGAVLAGASPAPATTWILRDEAGLTALHFGDATGVPTGVFPAELAEDASDAERATVRERLIKACGGSRTVVDIDDLAIDAGRPGDDALVIRRDDNPIELSLDDAQALDVRDQDELTSRRRARVRDTWLWRSLLAAMVVLLLSLVGEGVLFGLDVWQQGRRAQIAAQFPVVTEIQTAQRLANKVEERRTQRLRPFEMIALVDGPRPESIIFTDTRATGLYTMEIDAETDNQADVNIYLNALQELPGTQKVETMDLKATGSRTTLTLKVEFAPGAFAPPEPEPAIETVATLRGPTGGVR